MKRTQRWHSPRGRAAGACALACLCTVGSARATSAPDGVHQRDLK